MWTIRGWTRRGYNGYYIWRLGADSLDLFQVVIEIEERYGIQLEDAESIKSVRDAVEYVEKKVNK